MKNITAAIITTLTVSLAVAYALANPPTEGYLSRYDQRPTDATLAHRLEMGEVTQEQVDEADVLIAVLACSRLGEMGQMEITNSEMVRVVVTYLVFDCAGVDAQAWMVTNGIVAELGYHSAQRYLGERGGWGRVLS